MEDATEERRQHSCAILSTFKQFYEQGKYWDVRVQVGAEVFKCHRAILAANSVYFDTTFSDNNSAGSNANGPQIITLPDDMDAKAFERILRFIYTGEIHAMKNTRNILKLLDLSDFLELRTDHFKELMVRLVRGRSKKWKPMSCAIELLRYACEKDENVLFDIVSAHVSRHLYHFSEEAELMLCSFQTLNELLKRSKTRIAQLRGSADILVKIVHEWVNRNREVRSKYRLELMMNVDFAYVSNDLTLALMNALENVAEEVLEVYSEGSSFPVLESLGELLKVVRRSTDGLRGIILLHVPNISELPMGAEKFSPRRMISNLIWEISLRRSISDGVDVYLRCKGTADSNSEWNIYAHAIFVFKSHKKGIFSGLARFLTPELFSSRKRGDCGSGLCPFFSWNELFDPEKGLVADDDSVTLEAQVHADVPFRRYLRN